MRKLRVPLITVGLLIASLFTYGATNNNVSDDDVACEFYKTAQNAKSLYGGYVPEYCK